MQNINLLSLLFVFYHYHRLSIFRDDGGTILACDLIISKHPIGSGLFGAVYEARLPMKNQYFGQEGVSGSSCRKDSPPRQGSQISVSVFLTTFTILNRTTAKMGLVKVDYGDPSPEFFDFRRSLIGQIVMFVFDNH